MVGFGPDLQKRIFAVISAILLLGNVEFVKVCTFFRFKCIFHLASELVGLSMIISEVKYD